MKRPFAAAALAAAFVVSSAVGALADGTETLGPPSIPIAAGSGIVSAGTGMVVQPGVVTIDVPGEVAQALLYWEGHHHAVDGGDDTIVVDGDEVTGVRIGGPTQFADIPFLYTTGYRADVTGRISSGANSLTLSGLSFSYKSNGASLVVVYDDGTAADVQIRDGVDVAFRDFPEPRRTTVPQTYVFESSTQARTATLDLVVSSVEDGRYRPTIVSVEVAGVVTEQVDVLDNSDGDDWDTLTLDVAIPAGATSVTTWVASEATAGVLDLPASLVWIAGGLSVPVPAPPSVGAGSPGYWMNHSGAWPVEQITVGGVTYTKAGAIALMKAPPKGDATMILYFQLVAAKLNVANGTDPSCIAGTIAAADAWLVQHPLGSNPKNGARNAGLAFKDTLDDYNNGKLCAPKR